MIDLQAHRSDVFSQNGEDGVFAALFDAIGLAKGVFCDVGAWDGKHLSNTYNLYRQGWRGWYLESDQGRFRDLESTIPDGDSERIHATVGITGGATLDVLLCSSRLFSTGTRHIDLLSIDIDSDDLGVWKSLSVMRPKCVVIEHNPTIPFDTLFENPPGERKGNSARSILEFARSHDYDLVAVTATNLIFLDRAQNRGRLRVVALEDGDVPRGPRYFFGYDGSLIVAPTGENGEFRVDEIMTVPWSGAVFSQPIARPFRGYGSALRTWAALASSIASAAVRRPISSLKEMPRKAGRRLRQHFRKA